jgi:hypothetical protein
MKLNEIYPHILDAEQALIPFYDPTVTKAGEDFNLDGPETYLLFAIPTFEPEPVSAELLNVRSPYTNEEIYRHRLESMSRVGLLEALDPDHYRLTERGVRALKMIRNAANNAMASIAPLPAAELGKLATLLMKRVEACLTAPEPPGKWAITHSHKLDSGPGAAVMVRIDQYLTDLLAYRDDSHLAAWRPNNVSGHTWDVLTLLWLNESESIDTVLQKLSRRGNSFEVTEDALKDLVKLNWATYSLDIFSITSKGRAIRQSAEELTDAYYYAPWADLSEKDLDSLVDLLLRYKKGLNS